MKISDKANEILTKCVNSHTGEILIDTFGRKDKLECTYQIVTDGEKIGWTPEDTAINESIIKELVNAGYIEDSGAHAYHYTKDGFNYVRK
jgi:hypothetical protein